MENEERKQEPVTTEINSEETSKTTSETPAKPARKKGFVAAIKALGGRIADVFRDYPVTMIAIMIAALIFSILVEWGNRDTEIYLERAAAFFLITAMQSLFYEEVFKKKWIIRGTGYGISVLLSILYVWILSVERETIFGLNADPVMETVLKILVVQGTFMIGYAIWHMFRRLEENFEVYATKAFLELLKATVVYGLFAGGLATIVLIFNALIFRTGDFLEQVEIFLASGIYVPMCLKAISGKNEEPGKFFRVCIHYVLLPMLLIAFGIIYLYIGKIFLLNDVPSNKIFFILACLFTVGMPIWTSVHGLQKKDDLLSKVAMFLPYAFLPFLILQCWALGIRIAAYGITVQRYWGVILILCELAYFVLYFLHHKGNKLALSWILFVLMGMCFFTILCPGTSFEDTVVRSQMTRITKLLDKGDLTEEEKSSVKSAYRTVKYSGYKGKQELDNKLTDAQKDMIDTFDEYGYLTHNRIYLNDYRNDDYIEVAGYSRICRVTTVSGDASYLGDGKLSLQYSNFEKRSGSKPMVADVSELIEYALSFKDNRDRNFSLEEHHKCPVDADRSVWITSFSIGFDGDTKEIDSIHLDGYILEK